MTVSTIVYGVRPVQSLWIGQRNVSRVQWVKFNRTVEYHLQNVENVLLARRLLKKAQVNVSKLENRYLRVSFAHVCWTIIHLYVGDVTKYPLQLDPKFLDSTMDICFVQPRWKMPTIVPVGMVGTIISIFMEPLIVAYMISYEHLWQTTIKKFAKCIYWAK